MQSIMRSMYKNITCKINVVNASARNDYSLYSIKLKESAADHEIHV